MGQQIRRGLARAGVATAVLLIGLTIQAESPPAPPAPEPATELGKPDDAPTASLELHVTWEGKPFNTLQPIHRAETAGEPVITEASPAEDGPGGVPLLAKDGVYRFPSVAAGPGSVVLRWRVGDAASYWSKEVTLVSGALTRVDIDLDTGGTIQIPACVGCIVMFASSDSYARVLALSRAATPPGEAIYQDRGTFFFPWSSTPSKLFAPPGDYYVVFYGGQDNGLPKKLEDALPKAVKVHLETGAKVDVPLP